MVDDGGILNVESNIIEISESNNQLFPELAHGSYMAIAVHDSGKGLDEKELEKIFEPFSTPKDNETSFQKSLSVSSHIIKSMKGTITASSQLNKGSVFTIYLPVIHKEKKTSDFSYATTSQSTDRKVNIIIIDDEEALTDINSIMLSQLGHNVKAFTESIRALEYLKEFHDITDLIILDQTMPNLTGLNLAKKMFQINKDIPIILTSGYSQENYTEKLQETNIVAFLKKPISRSKLIDAVKNAILNK